MFALFRDTVLPPHHVAAGYPAAWLRVVPPCGTAMVIALLASAMRVSHVIVRCFKAVRTVVCTVVKINAQPGRAPDAIKNFLQLYMYILFG